jgi:hypothetical protein
MKLAESSMSDEEKLFKSICVGDIKQKLADTKVNYFKQDTVDVHITVPFHHAGKSHWVVVYGENKEVCQNQLSYWYMVVAYYVSGRMSPSQTLMLITAAHTMILVFASISLVLRVFGNAPEQKKPPITNCHLCILITAKSETLLAKRN